MRCPICKHGETRPDRVTVALDRTTPRNVTVVFRNVPAEVCANCGEEYVSETTTGALLRQAEAVSRGEKEVEVLQFAA